MSNDHTEINTGNGPRKFFSSGTSAKTVPFDSIPIIDFSAMFGEDSAKPPCWHPIDPDPNLQRIQDRLHRAAPVRAWRCRPLALERCREET